MSYPILFGNMASSGVSGFESDYELISTTLISSNTPSVTFNNLGDYSSDYKHLQVRLVHRTTRTQVWGNYFLRFNGDTGSNYRTNQLYGNGSSVNSSAPALATAIENAWSVGASGTANVFSASVYDILDPYSTSKNTTVRSLNARPLPTDNVITLDSGLWMNTASITSIEFAATGWNFVSGSRFSLYGIRG